MDLYISVFQGMSESSLPLLKLFFQIVRQAAKPIANKIGERAKESPVFRNWLCVPIGQGFHFIEIRVKMRNLNLTLNSKVTKVPRLPESKAVEKGSELLSEIIVLGISSSLLVFEYNRQSDKEIAKEERMTEERDLILGYLCGLEEKIDNQRKHLTQLNLNIEQIRTM